MSGIIRGVKRVFKRVVKVIKKIAPIALAVGALVFTGGAALGLTSMAGGWGATAASISSALGATGTAGAALTGAITQAGYGALIGGGISKLSGGSFSKGAQMGALSGAVTGGVTGAFKSAAAGAQGAQQGTATASQAGSVTGQAGAAAPTAAGQTAVSPAVQGALENTQGILTRTGEALRNTGGTGGLLSKVGGWVERNQTLVGNTVSGLGQGLLSGASADAEKDLLKERYRRIEGNYAGTNPSGGYRSLAPGEGGKSPTERFTPGYYAAGRYEFRYSPQSGRIERVPVNEAT